MLRTAAGPSTNAACPLLSLSRISFSQCCASRHRALAYTQKRATPLKHRAQISASSFRALWIANLRPGGGGRKLAEAHRTFSAENCKEEKSQSRTNKSAYARLRRNKSALLEAVVLTGTVHAQSVAVLQGQNTYDRWGETSLEQEIIYPDPKGQKAQPLPPQHC